MKTCLHCGVPIVFTDDKYLEQRSRQKYCSASCRQNAYGKRVYVPGPHAHLPSAVVGSANELRVATDLMLKGYEVFRALAHTCSCDLIALKNGQFTRVEVKTGHKAAHSKHVTFFDRGDIRADLLAIVLLDEIVYHKRN